MSCWACVTSVASLVVSVKLVVVLSVGKVLIEIVDGIRAGSAEFFSAIDAAADVFSARVGRQIGDGHSFVARRAGREWCR